MKSITTDDFLQFKFLSNIEYSPNGEHACFVVHQPDFEQNNYQSNLWIYTPKQDRYFQLTSFDQERNYIWLADSEHILFAGTRNQKDRERQKAGEELTVFYQISIFGGEAQEAFQIPLQVGSLKQLNTHEYLFTAMYNPHRPSLDSLSESDKEMELKRRKEDLDYEVLEEIPYWSNGEGFISGSRNRLYTFNTQTKTYKPLLDADLAVEGFWLSPDKKKAVLIASTFQHKQGVTNFLYILDLKDNLLHKLATAASFSYTDALFINDHQLVCLASEMDRFGLNENPRFYTVDVQTGNHQLLTPDFDYSTWNSVGSDCRYGGGEQIRVENELIYFVTTEGHCSHLNRLDLNGNIKRMTEAKGSVDAFAVQDAELLFIGLRQMGLQELYKLESSKEIQVTHFNDWVKTEREIIALEPLQYEATSGVVIDGWVMKPVGWQQDQYYPAILTIHGGPKTVYGDVFYHEMQCWAHDGYFVFFCNPRGSDGKGNEFADIRGKYGTIDYDDIMGFTDLVFRNYSSINTKQVGVTGGSYGGFMTNWIIGHTHQFKAAVSQRSISNWASMACSSDIGYYFVEDQMKNMPWVDYSKLWHDSPLKYADQVRTPTLFIHSEEDYRCWLVEGLQMFTALKYHGVEARLCMFRGENHELSRSGKPKPRMRRLQEIMQWFETYLSDKIDTRQ